MELAQVELADAGGPLGTMGLAVDEKTTGPTDALAAVVLEPDGTVPGGDQPFVEQVEGLQDGEIGGDRVQPKNLEAAGLARSGMAPDPQGERKGSHGDLFCLRSVGDGVIPHHPGGLIPVSEGNVQGSINFSDTGV